MKSILKDTNKPLVKYPCLRKFDEGNLVVLFSSCNEGVVIHSDSAINPVGTYRESWDYNQFSDYQGQVTLEND